MAADAASRAAVSATVALLVAAAAVAQWQGGPPSKPSQDYAPENERNFYFVINDVVTDASKKYFNIIDITLEKWRQECSYIDGLVEIVEDVPEDMLILINVENKQGNTWSSLAPTGPIPFCKYMEEQKEKMEMLWRASNFSHECPLLKNGVFLRKFVVLETIFPQNLIGDEWRLVLTFLHQDEEILNVKVTLYKLPVEKREKCDEEDDDEEDDGR